MAYKHGIYASGVEVSLIAPIIGTAGLQVIVGAAPVNMLRDLTTIVSAPLLMNSYREAVEAVDYNDDFEAYTLRGYINAALSVVGMTPMVLINVLDPMKHKADIPEKTMQVNDGVAMLNRVGVLLEGLTIKTDATPLGTGKDYTTIWSSDGTLNIVLFGSGASEKATTLTAAGSKIDPGKVKVTGTVNDVDVFSDRGTGLEMVWQVYPELSIIPGILLTPRFSANTTISAALQAETKNISDMSSAVCIVNISSKTDGAVKYADVKTKKEGQAVSDSSAYAV